ncbi:unnamed protein product [Rangifer tarandus platyrhynchus]|uniref:Olfactory receptor n=1 Tax=Rangifer tarandus platyrhynchus TaxID=3082113 RepID=A0ABN8Z1W5_RANTA|nr:unnamed protein product [Rangifer tarandus platyrhynchus]
MAPENDSSVTEFILLGLTQKPELQLPLFFVFLAIYVVTVVGNVGLIILIALNRHLHTPMYYFLFNLSFTDLCYSSVITPKMLMNFLSKENIISYMGCMTQFYFFCFFVVSECYVLTSMAYDRYVAICNPLLYASMMSGRTCVLLATTTWLSGSLHSAVQTTLTFRLPFCGPNQIQHYFCDAPPILKLACADTSANELVIFVNIGVVASGCFLLIVLSYVSIVHSILKIRTSEGRWRAFQTCASHCTVVLCFFVPCVFIYLRPGSKEAMDRIVAVFYTVMTPLLNPVVYTLRNKEAKKSLLKLKDKVVHSQSK